MANHLRICIVGGRSFGKTALVKAVAHIPCFVVRNYKGAADRLEKMSFDDSAWEQTKWDDVKDWQFKFTVEEECKAKDKILSFADYAGEYFEEDYEDSPTGTEENKVEETKIQKLLRKLWPWGGHKKAKRQINKLFYHPDGVIILLPRDFGRKVDGKDFYKRSLYEKRVLEYLEKVRPGTPVQIVISKWDLNDEQEPRGASAVEIMSSPVFKTCYERILNGYRSCNGAEYNAGIIGISTKEKGSDGRWIDSKNENYNEGYNVRELFTKMSHVSDVARTERLKADWTSAKWWKRWFVMPWRSLDVRLKNSDDQEVKGIVWRSWLRLGTFAAAVSFMTCVAIVTVAGLTETIRLDDIESDIVAATASLDKVTKEKLAEIADDLGTNKWIQPILFMPRLSELKGKLNELNTNYVAFLEKDLDGKLNDPRVKVGSPWNDSPDVRLGVVSNRLSIVKEQIKKLPDGMSSEAISQRLKMEEVGLAYLIRDIGFDKALYGLSKMGEDQKLRGMDDIRKRFQYMKSYRTNDFSRLDTNIVDLEKKLSTTLSNKLDQLEKECPGGDLSIRNALAQRKIDAINYALTNVFVLGSAPYKEWTKRSDVVKRGMANDTRYDPFDTKYATLDTNNHIAVAMFIEKCTIKKYPNRENVLNGLVQRDIILREQIMNGVTNKEKEYDYNGDDKSFEWRIEQASSLTNVYSVALGKLRGNDDEYTQIDKKRQSTADWISNHVKYIEVEKALVSAMAEPETNRVRAIVKVLRTYDKDAYPEYTNRLAKADAESKRLSVRFVLNCTKEIVALRKRGGTWQVKVKDAQERIKKIEGVLPSVLDSDRPTLENLIKQENEEISSLRRSGNHYDPFDKSYAELDTSDLKAIAKFKVDYPSEKYQERGKVYKTLTEREKDLLKQIMAGVEQKEGQYGYADKNRSFAWRIGQAANLTNVYSVALAKLRKSDDEYTQIDKKHQSTTDWISGHVKYIEVENALSSAMNAPETNRVLAIVEVLKGYGKDLYPEFTNHLENASKEAKLLSAKFVRDATNQNSIARTNQKGSWQIQVNAAKARISDIKSVFSSVLEEDMPTLQAVINEEGNLIADLKRGGEFDDAFAKVKQMPIETVINEIMFFRERFKEADFGDRSNAYNELIVIETNALARIAQNFHVETNNIPEVAETNFLGRLERSRKLCAAYDHALDCIPSNHIACAAYRRGLDNEASNARKYATWVRMNDEAMELMKTAKDLPQEEGDERFSGQQLMIMKVGGFLSRYPEKDNLDRELSEIYVGIKGVLSNAENEVFKAYKEEGKAFEITAGMSDEDKFRAMKDRKALCEKYKNMFLMDSDEYHTIGLEIDELRRNLGDVEFEREFRTAYDDVKREIRDDGKSASVRIDKASRFISDYDKPDYIKKSFVANAVEYVKGEKASLKIIDNFDQLKEKVDRLVERRPTDTDDSDSDKFHAHKKACLDLAKEIKPFRTYLSVANQAERALRKLAEEVKLMENKVGNGSWDDIKTKEKKYKKEMSQENYKSLMAAIRNYDVKKDENVHAGNVKEIREKVETDRKLAEEVKSKKQKFIDNPNLYAEFLNAIERFCKYEYRSDNDPFKKACQDFYSSKEAFTFDWKLCGFDFENTYHQDKNWGDYAVELFFNGTSVCKVSDIKRPKWVDGEYYEGTQICGKHSIAISGILQIKIKHLYTNTDDVTIPITGAQIVAWGMNKNGETDCRLSLPSNGWGKQATITLRFSGLPFLSEENF